MTKFKTFLGKNNDHHFRLINGEGDVLLSSESYIPKKTFIVKWPLD
ncbi:MAG: hypothetical protein ABI691_19830 [Ginsengibacter sp.]